MEKSYRYRDVEKYILEIPKFTAKNDPARTARFWEWLGRPGAGAKVIHVAGTNGKGSVCSYLNALLCRCERSVGMFTSPHLVSMTERLRLQGKPVEEECFAQIFTLLMGRLEAAGEEPEFAGYHPAFFEFLFFMAMLLFEKEKVEYIILETGLGGRLDATNCVPAPLATVITRIGLDHMEYLGGTVEEIAAEKAGIIKKGAPVFCLEEPVEAFRVIRRRAEELGAPLYTVTRDDRKDVKFNKKSIDFLYKSRYYDYIRLFLGTTAVYQAENAALAVRALETAEEGLMTKDEITEGIREAFWEGRMEEIRPGVFIDGAHNEDGIRAFLESVRHIAPEEGGRRELLFSAVRDKQYVKMAEAAVRSGLFGCLAAAPLGGDRGASKEELSKGFEQSRDTECIYYDSVEEAFRALISRKGEKDIIFAAGSLYLVGRIKALLKEEPHDQF